MCVCVCVLFIRIIHFTCLVGWDWPLFFLALKTLEAPNSNNSPNNQCWKSIVVHSPTPSAVVKSINSGRYSNWGSIFPKHILNLNSFKWKKLLFFCCLDPAVGSSVEMFRSRTYIVLLDWMGFTFQMWTCLCVWLSKCTLLDYCEDTDSCSENIPKNYPSLHTHTRVPLLPLALQDTWAELPTAVL